MSTPVLPPKNLVVLGLAEGVVMISAVIRFAFPGLLDLARPPHLAWFVGTVMLAGAGIAQYVLRSSLLMPRVRAGEKVEDDLRQIMAVSLAIIGLAGLISLAGPQLVERLIGG